MELTEKEKQSIRTLNYILQNDKESLRILKGGIEKSFDEAIGYIENEK